VAVKLHWDRLPSTKVDFFETVTINLQYSLCARRLGYEKRSEKDRKVYLLHSLRLTLFFFPRLSSLPLATPRVLMKEGAWTCALLSGRNFSTRLVTLGVFTD